jgi:hypothetical protein
MSGGFRNLVTAAIHAALIFRPVSTRPDRQWDWASREAGNAAAEEAKRQADNSLVQIRHD